MKFLVKLILPLVKTYLIQELTKSENRTFVVNKLSEHIDLPNLTKDEESHVVENIYDALTKILQSYLNVKTPIE